jgi:hypothetical protein
MEKYSVLFLVNVTNSFSTSVNGVILISFNFPLYLSLENFKKRLDALQKLGREIYKKIEKDMGLTLN